MPRYFFIRHGESVWNGERRIQGNQDPALSERGRRQADLLTAALAGRLPAGLPAIYTSPLRRAAETAEILSAATGLPVIPEPGFREMVLGRWEGMTVPEIQAAYPGAYERWLEDPGRHPAPGGERLEAFCGRVVGALEEIRRRHPGANLVVVAHGGPVRALLCHVLGLDPRHLYRLKQDNTAISEVELGPAIRRVVRMNDTHHLTAAGADLAPKDVLVDGGASDTTV
jgi:alpha-ribazole phosphatase